MIRASGIPMTWMAWKQSEASSMALGLALPISSEARMSIRRAMNFGSSPPAIIRASQYTAALGSLPRIDLMKAEIMS